MLGATLTCIGLVAAGWMLGGFWGVMVALALIAYLSR